MKKHLLLLIWPLSIYGIVALGIYAFIRVGFELAVVVAVIGSIALTLLMTRIMR